MEHSKDQNEVIKVTEEELQKLNSFINADQAITTEFGMIMKLKYQVKERQLATEEAIRNLQAQTQDFYKKIEEKYGPGSVDINTGIFTPSNNSN